MATPEEFRSAVKPIEKTIPRTGWSIDTYRPGYHAGRATMPAGLARPGYHAVRDAMPCWIPCRAGDRAEKNTVPCWLPLSQVDIAADVVESDPARGSECAFQVHPDTCHIGTGTGSILPRRHREWVRPRPHLRRDRAST